MKKLFSAGTFKNAKTFAKAHKIVSGLVAIGVASALYGTFKPVNTAAETHYVLGTATVNTIDTSVSGTGQVSASNQVNVSAKASGYITSVSVKTGDTVAAGDLLASIDPGDADLTVQNAQLSLEKLTEAPDPATLVQAQEAVANAQSETAKDYDDAQNDVTSAFLDLPAVMDGMNDLLYTTSGYLYDSNVSSFGPTAVSYAASAGSEFDKAQREYNALTTEYGTVTETSATSTKDALIANTINMLNDLSTSMTQAESAVDYVKTISTSSSGLETKESDTAATTAQTNLSGWIDEINGHLTSITTDQTNIAGAPADLAAAQDSLSKLQEGADPLDIQSDQLSLEQAQQNYDDYFIDAPFAGIVGKLDVAVGDSVSSGTTVATLVTSNQVANVTLNEVDAAKVKVGDKAMLTFDAVSGLTITGTVSNVDLVGTVTQGVVTYNAEITFDTEDPRVLSGMSVSANIITDAETNVLTVPSSAIKTSAQGSYVSVFNPPFPASSVGGTQGVVSAVPPTIVPVTTGISDNTNTEIVSGLTAGEQIVTRVVAPTTGSATAAAPSLLSAATGRAGGAGAAAGGGGAARSFSR